MTSLHCLLRRSLHEHAARPAVSVRGETVTYRELASAADRLASRLAAAPLGSGERVGIVAPNLPSFAVALLATWRVGAVAVPLSARWRGYELARALADARVSAVVSPRVHGGYAFAELLPELLPGLPTACRCLFVDEQGQVEEELAGPAMEEAEPLGRDAALILYTSGTTGEPKGALITHAAQATGALELNRVLAVTDDDRVVFVVPTSHAFGLQCLVAALAAGAEVVMVDSTISVEPTLRAIGERHATVLHGSPALFASLLKSAPSGLPSVRAGFVAGAPSPGELLEQYDRRGTRILNLYGMTELGAATCVRSDDPPEVRYRTVGRPLAGLELRVAGESSGELFVRGPSVTPGYFHGPAQTAEAFADSWLRTGDLGSFDERGNLTIVGRARDLVKVGGLAVFPAEVEGLLLTHPDVDQAAVVGVPHRTMGEALQAFVVPREDSDLAPPDLLRFARERIAGYKLPYAIRFVPRIPLLTSGKPDRLALSRLVSEDARGDC